MTPCDLIAGVVVVALVGLLRLGRQNRRLLKELDGHDLVSEALWRQRVRGGE